MTAATELKDQDTEKESDTRSVWNAPFVLISLVFMMWGGFNVVFGPAKRDIATDLGVSMDQIVGTRTMTAFMCALVIIPAAILVSRLTPGALAWIGTLLVAVGAVISGVSPNIVLFYVGAILGSLGAVLTVPLVAQIGRDTLSTKTFVVAITIVVVMDRVIQAGSLSMTGLVYETIGWRPLYIGWGVALLPLSFLVWRFIKPTKPAEDVASIKKTLLVLGGLLKQPLVWVCGLSFGLTMSTVGKFGFIWNINLQTSLGWDVEDANLLTFMFVAGVIVGGYLVTLISKRIGQFPAILISIGSGAIMFSVCVFVTSSLRDIWVSSLMLFFVGLALGGGTMIQPYIAKFFDKSKSAMFFGLTTAMYLVFSGLIVSLPLWSLPDGYKWTAGEVRHALVPYAVSITVGIILFASTRFLRKPNQAEIS